MSSLLLTTLYDKHTEFNKKARAHNSKLDSYHQAQFKQSTTFLLEKTSNEQNLENADQDLNQNYMFESNFKFLLFSAAYPLLWRVCPPRLLFFIRPELTTDYYSSDEECDDICNSDYKF